MQAHVQNQPWVKNGTSWRGAIDTHHGAMYHFYYETTRCPGPVRIIAVGHGMRAAGPVFTSPGEANAGAAAICDNCIQTMMTDRSEAARMVLCVERSQGIFKRTRGYAVFFPDEVVFAHLSREREKAEGKAMLRSLRQKRENPLKNVISRINMRICYGDRYYTMNIRSILNEDPLNFALRHRSVEALLFKANQEDADLDDAGNWVGELIIETDFGETIELGHNYRDTNSNIQKVLYELYGERLEYVPSRAALHPGGHYGDRNRRFC
jgi:hypothetical protein